MKKTISIILSVLILFLLTVPAYAADTNIITNESIMSPQFTYIWAMSAGLGINSVGRAHYSGSVDAASNSYTANLTVSLQRYTGSVWSEVMSWYGSGPGQSGLIVEGYYYVSSGTYRVCTTAQIYDSYGTLLETESFYSAERTY